MAVNSKKYKFRGKVAWCFSLWNTDEYGDKEFWKLNFYPDAKTMKDIKATGTKARTKDDDGEKSGVVGEYFTFRRNTTAIRKGKTIQQKPPVVVGPDGEEMEEQSIGNGSTAEIEIEVYDTKKFGKGTRLERVKFIDIIEYNPPEEVEPDEDDEDEPEESTKEEPKPAKKKKVVW